MELHEYFMSIAELEPSIFEILGSTPVLQKSIGSIILQFIEDGFEKLNTANNSKRQLELLRLLLCQQYKLNYDHIQDNKIRFHTQFSQFVEFLTNSKLCTEKGNQAILYDIIILQLILFEDQKNFIQLFEDFRANCTTDQLQTVTKLPVDWYLKILKCFLKAWEILYFLNEKKGLGVVNKTHLESCKKVLLSSVMYDLQTWIQCKENDEWHALHSVLSKVVSIAKNTRILSPYVHEILDKDFTLTTICILCDFVFPINSLNIDIDCSLIHHNNLWCMIQNKLMSTSPQERKQALYLFKRLIDFIDANEQNIKKAVSLNLIPNKMNPFVCNRTETDKFAIRQLRTNFILIMEALEEKQKHLVIPCLSLVDSLIEGCTEHKSCGNCFDFSWIYCTFARILKHDNNAVVKWGLLRSLRLNTEAYDYEIFIILIVKTLNNTFLYEKFGDESEPETVLALTTWFNNFQSENLQLVQKFIYFFYGVSSWGPLPIFYILQSLLSTSDKLDDTVNLQHEQLDILRLLVETNIKLHPPMLRSMSEITLIKILSRFAEIQNLMILAKLISLFSENNIREPSCWPALISWLGKVHYNNIVNFIGYICKTLIVDDKSLQISMSTFALIIQLLFEGGIICQTEHCVVTQELTTLFLCLDKVDVRPYVKVSFVVKIIDLLYSLFDLQRQPPEFIYKLFIHCKETIFKFILKLFHNENFDYEHIKVCARALQNVNYYEESRVNIISIVTGDNSKDLEAKCIQVLSNIDKHNEIQLLFALQTWSNIFSCNKYENKFLLAKMKDLLKICQSKEHSNDLAGKIGLNYYIALSKLIKNYVLTLNSDSHKGNDDWLQILSSILDAAGNEVLIYFGDIVRFSISAVTNDDEKLENFKFLIKSFWCCNFGSKREKIFWHVAQKLTECINSTDFFKCKSLQGVSQEFTNRMLTEGDTLPGLKYILLTCSEVNQNFNFFMETILNGLLHGPVMRRDQRIHMQACMKGKQILSSYVQNGVTENFEAYNFLSRQYNVDAAIRAAAVVQLVKALHVDKEKASLFLPLVLEKLLSIQNKRYFADSQLHRLKHRIMQVLLLLQPHLDKESTQILYHVLRDSIIVDSDQHSVRLMKEWLLTRIYLSNEDLLSDLWLFFEKICYERPGSASSIIGITWHITQQLTKDNLSAFIKTALSKLGICCMGQQFGMRLYGQVFFIKFYELLDENSDIRLKYASFYKATLESLRCGNLKKNPFKIEDDFFYTIFNPIQHYSLETIYHQLPRLSNISIEEWITKENFEEQIFSDNTTIGVKVGNLDDSLDKAEIPPYILKSSENSKPEEIECSQITTDMQKKITPWKTLLPNEEELAQMKDLTDLKNAGKNKQDIIVVASLIEKSQNLGGIARTCEIFGIKELVASNLKQIEDKEFQVLSVSADKWIKITEVKIFSLAKYLLELKDCGWTLIGAEQTANSVNLLDLKFPKQTVLILGNEKNGIPANIIPLLDICIEIPQFGVIRSLNVHVTSAICIWEYVKQHRFVS